MFEQPVPARRGGWLWLWACVCCGDRMDETIRFHRALRAQETALQRHDRLMREIQVAMEQVSV